MIKPTIDELKDLIDFLYINCPGNVYSELSNCECHEVENCVECWDKSIYDYMTEESLKSMNDNEKREKKNELCS